MRGRLLMLFVAVVMLAAPGSASAWRYKFQDFFDFAPPSATAASVIKAKKCHGGKLGNYKLGVSKNSSRSTRPPRTVYRAPQRRSNGIPLPFPLLSISPPVGSCAGRVRPGAPRRTRGEAGVPAPGCEAR